MVDLRAYARCLGFEHLPEIPKGGLETVDSLVYLLPSHVREYHYKGMQTPPFFARQDGVRRILPTDNGKAIVFYDGQAGYFIFEEGRTVRIKNSFGIVERRRMVELSNVLIGDDELMQKWFPFD